MQNPAICPYYGHDEDLCDVGCGYISSHDASMIIRFCSCQFEACSKYKELADRRPLQTPTPTPLARPAPSGPVASIPVFGLFCHSLTTVSYSLDKLPFALLDLHLLAILLMFGAVGQITAGLNSLKTNPLRALTFTGLGLFWLSVLPLDVLPRAGFGNFPGQVSMAGYLVMWGLFCLVICQGHKQLTRASLAAFGLLTALLLLLATSQMVEGTTILYSAAIIGLASGLPGLVLACRSLRHEALHLLQATSTLVGRAH